MLLSNLAFNCSLRPSNLELGHIYCMQADYPQAQYHYEYAAHHHGMVVHVDLALTPD